VSFIVNKTSDVIPFYFTLTDTTVVSAYTSAVDYTRIWSILNMNTSAIAFFQTTSASVNYCISAGSIVNDTYTVSLSAVV
jgi:hypothetical protein